MGLFDDDDIDAAMGESGYKSASNGDTDSVSGGGGDSDPSVTGFDIYGQYANKALITMPSVDPRYSKAMEVYEETFYDLIAKGVPADKAATDAAAASQEYTPAGVKATESIEQQQGIQKWARIAFKLGALLGLPEVVVGALVTGLVSEAVEQGIDAGEIYDRMQKVVESGEPVTVETLATAFPEFGGGDGGGGSAIDVVGGIVNDTVGEGELGAGAYNPLGPTPFTGAGSPYQDLRGAIGDPLTGGELPPAFEQYRADLSAAHIAGLKDVLPEVFAKTRETGIGAVGGITSVYQDLKVGTERRIGEEVRRGELEARTLATEFYQKARGVEGQLAIEATTPQIDYLRGIEIAKVGGETSRDITEAQLEAEKYAGLFEVGESIFDLITGKGG